MEKKHIIEKRYTQPHSKFSNLRNSLVSPLASKNTLVERGSKISKSEMGHMGLMRPMENEKGSVEEGSKISKWRVGCLGSLRILGRKTGIENSSAQWHSKFSKWKICPSSPLRPSSPLKTKNSPAQQDSRISKLVLSSQCIPSLWRTLKYRWQNIVCSCLRRLQSGIFSNIFSSL